MTVLDACVDIEYEFVYFLIIIIELNNDNNNNDEIKVSKMGGGTVYTMKLGKKKSFNKYFGRTNLLQSYGKY